MILEVGDVLLVHTDPSRPNRYSDHVGNGDIVNVLREHSSNSVVLDSVRGAAGWFAIFSNRNDSISQRSNVRFERLL